MSMASGSQVGPYRLAERVSGSGGQERWSAVEDATGRPVTVLIAGRSSDPAVREEILTAYRRMAAVEHPSLTPVYGVGEVGEAIWVAVPARLGVPLGEDAVIDGASSAGLRSAVQALATAGVAPSGVGRHDVFVDGDRAVLVPGAPGAGTDPGRALRDLDTLAPARRAARRRGPLLAGVAVVAVGLAAVGAFLMSRGDDGVDGHRAPVATVRAEIELGAKPRAVAFAGDRVWVATSKGVLRVDPTTDTVVGSPIPPPAGLQAFAVVGGERAVWAGFGRPEGGRSVVSRIDPVSGRTTGSITVLGDIFDAVETDGRLRVAGRDAKGFFLNTYRTDDLDAAPVRREVPTRAAGITTVAGATWLADFDGTVNRVDHADGRVTGFRLASTTFGPLGTDRALWVPDIVAAGIAPFDRATGSPLGPSVKLPHQPLKVVEAGDALWVATVEGGLFEPSGFVVIARLDERSRALAGAPVEVGVGLGGMATDGESVWVGIAGDSLLVRLRPSAMPDPAEPAGLNADSQVRPLVSGPLGVGPRRTTVFTVPVQITVPDGDWLALAETARGVDLTRFDALDSLVSLWTVERLFRPDGRLGPARSPGQLFQRLRTDPRLITRPLPPITIDGRRAEGIRVQVRELTRGSACPDASCVALFPIPDGSFYLVRNPGEWDDIYAVPSDDGILFVGTISRDGEPVDAAARELRDLQLTIGARAKG